MHKVSELVAARKHTPSSLTHHFGGATMPTSTLKYRYNPLHQDIICSETALPGWLDVRENRRPNDHEN